MFLKIRVAFSFLALVIPTFIFAQGTGNSPYSQFGLGEIVDPAFVPTTAMGGIGISNANGLYINNINPALLARNRSTLFDVGVVGQVKQVMNGKISQPNIGGNLAYLAYAFPITKRWTLSAGLRPYSNVDYKVTSTGEPVAGTNSTANYTYMGTGGLASVELSNGITLLKDTLVKRLYTNLYVGLKATYVFGNITHEAVSQLNPDPVNQQEVNNQVAYINRTNYSDFLFKPAIALSQQLNKNTFLNVGVVYDMASNINGKRLVAFQPRRDGLSLINNNGYDTLSKDVKGAVQLPANFSYGLSLERPYHWLIGVDFTNLNWENFVNLDGTKPFGNGYRLAVGGSYTPDIASINNYWERVTYRAGFNYTKMPIQVDGKQINDFGINFGTTFPVGRGVSDLNLAFTLGQRGALTANNNSIKEQYFKIAVGFTLNGLYDRWFVKNKID